MEKINIFKRKNKRCPRCNFKMPVEMAKCPRCELNFQKFNLATNAEAKNAYSEGDGDRVLLRKGCPQDVSRIGLILITIFLGFMGAHYYYVGRVKMGVFYSVFFVVGLVNAFITLVNKITPTGDWYQLFYLLVLVWGVVIALWLVDIVMVCINKFKIPVSLPRV